MKVKIKQSNHSDIRPGDTGTVLGETKGGYAVEFTKPFQKADAIHKPAEIETRILYFTKKQVTVLLHDPEGLCHSEHPTGKVLQKPFPEVEPPIQT